MPGLYSRELFCTDLNSMKPFKELHNAFQNTGYLINKLVRYMLPNQRSVGAVAATGGFLSILFWVLLAETYSGRSFVTTQLPRAALAVTFFYVLLGFIELAVEELAPIQAEIDIIEMLDVKTTKAD